MSKLSSSLIDNIKSLLKKDIYMPYELIKKIELAITKMPEEKLVELLLVLQESSSVKEESLKKLLMKDNNLPFEYKMFLTKQFNLNNHE
jgi:hypothetical protein